MFSVPLPEGSYLMNRTLAVIACLVILNGCGSRDDETGSFESAVMVPTYELSLDREKSVSISIIDTIGSEYGDELYGGINDVDVYGDRLYLLDMRLSTLSIYDINTRSLIHRTELPRGEGPGEMYGPNQFCMDSDGYSYIWASDRNVHIFDDEFIFETKTLTLSSMLSLQAYESEIFLIPIFMGKTDKPAVEVIDQDGDVVAAFGHQHEDFEENWVNNRLQPAIYRNIASDSEYIYLASGLPLEIQAFTHSSFIPKEVYSFTPEYAGGQVESPSGSSMFPTGAIVGLCSYNDGNLLVFTNDYKSRTTYLNLINIQDHTYIECNLTEYTGEFMGGVVSASDGNSLFIDQNSPFPHVLIMRIEIIVH